ncbi:nuclear transport factor 2 family protein [Flavobacterium sp. HJSW_4]|uniref:nuclear transport factor 2 family protein n=1 Tax=Flavobacterium sp. HJSW_4 TaxID=3344660 RepID=UPI0035F2D2C7
MTIEQIIEKQMLAYTNRDIESMMALFSQEIKIVDFSDNRIIIQGIDECQKMYHTLFLNSPDLRAEILNSITFDNKVIVQEYIHGRNGSAEKMEQAIIFEINNEKIDKITVIKKN